MEPLVDLPWWLREHVGVLFAGLASGAYWVALAHNRDVDGDMFVSVIRRIIEAGNLPRALKITNAGHPLPVCVATKAAILAAVRVGSPESAARGGYRGGPNAALVPVFSEIARDYDEAFRKAAALLWRALFLALPSPFLLVLAAWGSFESWRPASFPWGMLLAVSGILALVYAGNCHVRIVLSRERVFRNLAPLFEQIARDGGRAVGGPYEAQERTIAT
ncbi:hypothetical protein [Polyangium jinanense]|uniref:Uncharacterized protein n=1 Tax=Polyangium jinanense TaxID=2829994 RepID=A0A9X3X7W9_9BACT|nr:hypothetical protein [Polyangium jinanense]MDC3959049.1 hypothetical protein [Polyangium jinanense]MDC3984028.1 hypothetical protein [Polyangium jinanense]